MSSTSVTDHEMSESSNSPASYSNLDSPYSSPSQQVPQLTTTLTALSCADKNLYNFNNGSSPCLQIVEQPQNHFRFRYVSEMVGTHGCLLGKSYTNSKTKTHPTVELVNYSGRALIRCQLAQHTTDEEHPHKLLEDEQDRDVSYTVPERGSYKVGFSGMGIIHTAKKDVSNLLFKKYSEDIKRPLTPKESKELRAHCDNLSKAMNLNIVRLKFSAHDIESGKEICDPVFSDPIHNLKSAATNDLKICRISMFSGRPRGGEDVFILVEKVNKKNVMIRFYEVDEHGERVWEDNGTFLQSDVHHQYAIVFRTPPCRDPETTVDVKVFIELVRPSDGRTSEPKDFTYKAEEVFKHRKKRKNNSYSSLDSSSGGSLTNDLPVTVTYSPAQFKEESENAIYNVQPAQFKEESENAIYNVQLPLQPIQPPSPSECGLSIALGNALTVLNPEIPTASPMWSQPTAVASPALPSPALPYPALPNLQLDSAELNSMARAMGLEDPGFSHAALADYLGSYNSSLGDIQPQMDAIGFSRQGFVPDSGRIKVEPQSSPPSTSRAGRSDIQEKTKSNSDYPGFYKPEDAAEVKRLVKELCEVIRNKKGSKNQEVRSKLERLFDIRLSNGDTFLHMTLCSNQPSFEDIVKVIYSVKMTRLLNLGNNKQQTILHLAVINGASSIVSLLVSKGCDPMLKDDEEDNAIHYAVRYSNDCLEPLLDAIQKNDVPCDLNACNSEKQSALHLCALHSTATCAALLLSRGASYNVRDALGRTPLHLCAYDARRDVARALLHHVTTSDIDAVDGLGNTALQIVCDRPLDGKSEEMVKLLLDKKADPMKHEDHNESAWKLTRDKPQLREVMKGHLPVDLSFEDDVKSEPDDEYESADDDMDSSGLSELNLYAREVAARVEAAGKWRELARRLDAEALLSWFSNQRSPVHTLLLHVKECRNDITSKSLALILDDMGLADAANIIRSHIE